MTATAAERRSAPAATAGSVAVTLSATERRSSAQKRAHAEPLTAVRPEAPFAPQLPSKHATPELNISCNLEGEAFSGKMRPSVLSADYASTDVGDPEVALVNNLATTTHELGVQTGTDFWDQWRTDFLHWAFPFSLPAPASGPDYPQKPKFRRVADAPVLGPTQHLKHITGRVESSIRNSWDLVPGLRRITSKWAAVCGGALWRRWNSHRKQIEPVPVSEWVRAAEGLYQKLRRGKYVSADGRERPIQYDTRILFFAKGPHRTRKPTVARCAIHAAHDAWNH